MTNERRRAYGRIAADIRDGKRSPSDPIAAGRFGLAAVFVTHEA